jgi:hypothetical protein
VSERELDIIDRSRCLRCSLPTDLPRDSGWRRRTAQELVSERGKSEQAAGAMEAEGAEAQGLQHYQRACGIVATDIREMDKEDDDSGVESPE